MNKTEETFQTLRDRQLSWGIRTLAGIGTFALLFSLLRAITVGWQAVMGLHIVLYLIILGTALLTGRLSFMVRAIILLAAPFILGVTGLITWGLAGLGLPALLTSCILGTVLFGSRVGIIVSILSILMIGMIGFLFSSGLLTLGFDPKVYLTSYTSWIAAIAGMAIGAGLIVKAIGSLNREIENLVHTLQNRNAEMSGIIRRLEDEITERVRMEEERSTLESRLQRAERMEALGTLAGGVAHDLNNILVGAVSLPDLLLAKLPEGSPLRNPIELIQRSGVKAATIVQDLLTLARRGVASTSVLNLNTTVMDYFSSPEYQTLKSFHPQVEVELNLDQELPNMLGSSIHLLKALMNLVSNAAEAMPDGGKISVSTQWKHFGFQIGVHEEIEEGDYIVLRVSDTGIGISSDNMEKIFEPFYTKKVMGRSGTGLGMAVVWGTVKDHKGHIDIESTLGQGTTFSLYFPGTEEKEGQTQLALPLAEDVEMGRGEAILIVDDVKEQREITAEMLRELGYSVNTAASGEEALSYLEKSSADLLILDMYMEPGLDGLDTYRRVLKIQPRQKAIIASGYSETWRVREAQKLGVGCYLRKPFLMSTVGAAVRAELDKETAQPKPSV